jgi:hypothetical protein
MVCYAEPVFCESLCAILVVGNHVVLCWGSGCESWCVKLIQWLWIMVFYAEQWLWIMVSYDEPVVVHHGVIFWASDCESRCVIQSPVVVNHVVLYCPSGCESVCYAEQLVVINCELCWASGCESCYVMLIQSLFIIDVSTELMVVHHGALCWASDCEWRSVIVNHGD